MKAELIEFHLAMLNCQLRIEQAKLQILTTRPPTLELDLCNVTQEAIKKEIQIIEDLNQYKNN
jgi:hypothetical protein